MCCFVSFCEICFSSAVCNNCDISFMQKESTMRLTWADKSCVTERPLRGKNDSQSICNSSSHITKKHPKEKRKRSLRDEWLNYFWRLLMCNQSCKIWLVDIDKVFVLSSLKPFSFVSPENNSPTTYFVDSWSNRCKDRKCISNKSMKAKDGYVWHKVTPLWQIRPSVPESHLLR